MEIWIGKTEIPVIRPRLCEGHGVLDTTSMDNCDLLLLQSDFTSTSKEVHDSEAYSSGEEEEDEVKVEVEEAISVSGLNLRGARDPAYMDMRKIQLRPYGQEDDGNEDDRTSDTMMDDGDLCEELCNTAMIPTRHEYVNDAGLPSNQVCTFHNSDHDVRDYYNSVDWRETDEYHDPHTHKVRSESTFIRSRERITRSATHVKAKFYKLLKQRHHGIEEEENHPGQYQGSYLDENDDDPSPECSVYSVTSSLRARMRLNSKAKTLLRRVKRHLSSTARSVMSEANKAASKLHASPK
ncbi:hypothetical protein BGZ65_008366 [Modicella reniformis]|uniref:Uncharacterized protein n=1 Tax=Modicella reniformis TaxID=1440133 RepID=A0A9P6IIX6_9FUNG|nr:hypothetical protein BGZ65_008366 [Modicella reniformis]